MNKALLGVWLVLPLGAWAYHEGPGQVFGTATAVLILEIPYCFLPIFQR